MRFPVTLIDRGDGHAHDGTDADGRRFHFEHDVLAPGDLVGQGPDGECGPFGRVVARDGGLFIDASPADDHAHAERVRKLLAPSPAETEGSGS